MDSDTVWKVKTVGRYWLEEEPEEDLNLAFLTKEVWNNPFSNIVSHNLDLPARLRIKSRKEIEFLVETRNSLFQHPFLLKYHFEKLQEGLLSSPQFAITVPKKHFRKAHDRKDARGKPPPRRKNRDDAIAHENHGRDPPSNADNLTP